MRTITYAKDLGTGYVCSRVGDEMCIPIIDFSDMGPEDNFAIKSHLERIPFLDVVLHVNLLHTRKIPREIKNEHRAFWGMRLLPAVLP